MNQLQRFNETLKYLENSLDGNIDEKKIGQISGYSYPLFRRVFSIISGITLEEYLRNRKLTKAAMDLRHGDEKIIDIGLKYGYDSSKAFSVAFKRFHGKRPSDVRKGGDYRVFTPIYFALTMKGGNNMDIKIEKKPAFTLGGLQVHNKGGTDFGELWNQLFEKFDEEDLIN